MTKAVENVWRLRMLKKWRRSLKSVIGTKMLAYTY